MTLITFFVYINMFAHKDVGFKYVFDNIKVTVFAPYHMELMNKPLIIGKYARLLTEKLKYKDTINLTFSQNSIESNNSIKVYFLDKNENSENKGLNIYLSQKDFDIKGVLNLIEYACLNIKKINNNSKDLNLLYNKAASQKINEILNIKVYRPNLITQIEQLNRFTYYYANNEFHIVAINPNGFEREIKAYPNIIDFRVLNNDILILLLDFSTLCVITGEMESNITKITNIDDFYRPYLFSLLSENKISIEYPYWQSGLSKKLSLYFIERKKLVEDIDELISK